MSKSLLYSANTNVQTVNSGGTVNFGSPVRRYGCDLNSLNGNVRVNTRGYYTVSPNLTFTATAGTAVITVLQDNVPITGATASLTTAADTVYTISFPAVLRQCCDCDSVISVSISGVTATVTNATVTAVKE